MPVKPSYPLLRLLLALAVALGGFRAQNSSVCLPPTILSAHGFWASSSNITQAGVCTPYYVNNGSCVAPNDTQTYLNNFQSWFNQMAANAYSFTDTFQKSFVFWAVAQGTLTAPNLNTVLPSNIPWLMDQMVATYYTRASTWIQSIRSQAVQAIPPCFQALANITNGIYCAVTSSYNLTFSAQASAFPHSIPMTLLTNSTIIGGALQTCLPLIDNYCIISYGISTSTTNLPFNFTVNLGDGGLTATECQTLQTLAACTLANCTAKLNTFLTNKFATNWIPFVPAAHIQNNLNNYLNHFDNGTTFSPITSQPFGIGIGLVGSSSANYEDFFSKGQLSGQPSQTYQRSIAIFLANALWIFFISFW